MLYGLKVAWLGALIGAPRGAQEIGGAMLFAIGITRLDTLVIRCC